MLFVYVLSPYFGWQSVPRGSIFYGPMTMTWWRRDSTIFIDPPFGYGASKNQLVK